MREEKTIVISSRTWAVCTTKNSRNMRVLYQFLSRIFLVLGGNVAPKCRRELPTPVFRVSNTDVSLVCNENPFCV